MKKNANQNMNLMFVDFANPPSKTEEAAPPPADKFPPQLKKR